MLFSVSEGGYEDITLLLVQDNSNFDNCPFFWHFQMGSDSSNADFLDLGVNT